MITKAFSVFDAASEAFSPPFFANTDGLARRSFADLVNDPKTSVSQYPDQFTLYEIGSFDDASGLITALVEPKSLGLASSYKTA